MAAGKGLETQPPAELVGIGISARDDVFVTYSVASLPVKARFVGCDHSRQKGLLEEILPYALRAFVNAKIEAYAVARTVTEIAAGLPHIGALAIASI